MNKRSITKKVDKKEFIDDLKAITTAYIDITFMEDSPQVIIQQPKSNKFINHIAKD